MRINPLVSRVSWFKAKVLIKSDFFPTLVKLSLETYMGEEAESIGLYGDKSKFH